MSKLTISPAASKRCMVELVVDRKVVERTYIDEKEPMAFFSAEYIAIDAKDKNGMSIEAAIEIKKRESNIRKAEEYLCEFFKLLAKINETDHEAVEELLEILLETVVSSKAGTDEDEEKA